MLNKYNTIDKNTIEEPDDDIELIPDQNLKSKLKNSIKKQEKKRKKTKFKEKNIKNLGQNE